MHSQSETSSSHCYTHSHPTAPKEEQQLDKQEAMKMISAIAIVLLAALVLQQQLAVPARADISCSTVFGDMEPCLSFLQGSAASPSAACCAGVRTLYAAADTTANRQATCECLKTAYRQVNAQLAAAQALPKACGLSLPYTITPDINCKTIQ